MNNNEIQIWNGPDGISIPANAKEPIDIVSYANSNNLTVKHQNQIVAAFQIEAFDMAAEYAWKRAMIKLKETISTLGMNFIGEMLGREDINDFTPIDTVLTDYATIQLAEQLGVIGNTAALKLRQSQELISHFFSGKADEEFDYASAVIIVKSSVQYILGEQDISIAIEFTNLRKRLLNESLKRSDAQVEQLVNSPLFYIRTVLTILLSSIKKENKGAVLENTLANLNLLLPEVWDTIGENDKWNIGSAYRDVVAEGNSFAANGLKSALLKVKGFDFVPENLRSTTFKNAARTVIETHFAFNNFYNEPSAVRALASLGLTIPAPALTDCIQAYLVVYLGNYYGVSIDAAPIAYRQLSNITRERWYYYFEKVIIKDEVVLGNMRINRQIDRFSGLLIDNGYNDFNSFPKEAQMLYDGIIKKNYLLVIKLSEALCMKLKKNK
ncbi:hypothetical protein EZS27_021951 [termite gut metagenome]|uniref:Uncharacterized protein n=1 Tax=termite gut metagenome TaxID=433724 RepID=A0A5J4R7X6_9ZZZZ